MSCSAAAELNAASEATALYAALRADGGPPARCKARRDDGAWTLVYEFGARGNLLVRRDDTIESTELRASFTTAVPMPERLLQLTERDQFGDAGCGINWQRPDLSPAQTSWQGTTCQCRASVLREGEHTILAWRSTC